MQNWELRMETGKRLIEWGIVSLSKEAFYGLGDEGDPVYNHLAWLLGYKNGLDLMYNFHESDRDKLEALLGPYGLTIYRIMVLRHG